MFLIGLRLMGGLQFLELSGLDFLMRSRPLESPDRRVLIVGMDEQDIRRYNWPLPDDKLAALIETLSRMEPAVIGLDLYRDLPVGSGYHHLVRVFRNTPNLIGIEKTLATEHDEPIAPPPALKAQGQVSSNDIVVDPDGKVRRVFLFPNTADQEPLPSLGLTLALFYLETQGITYDPDSINLKLGGTEFRPFEANDGGYVQAEANGYQVLLNLRGPRGTFERVSVRDVLDGQVSPDQVKGRVVLIGAVASSLNDVFYTAYNDARGTNAMPGVEIQANLASQIISAILADRPLIQVWSDGVEWLWILFWSVVGAVIGWWWRSPLLVFGLTLLIGAGLVVLSYFMFLQGWWLPLMPGVLSLGLSAIVMTGWTVALEQEERKLVMNLFGRHVSAQIAEAIWLERDQILKSGRLADRKLTATILFTDLKDFSSIAEQTDPQSLMRWLNEYMEAMAQLVLDHGGTVDKFIGDSIMAVFGVPIARTTEAEINRDTCRAIHCALAMGETLKKLNHKWQQENRPVTAMRIGIATGEVVTGSLGSSQRLDFTTIGDCVNVASRLESYARSGDISVYRILISEETQHRCQNSFITKAIGKLMLRGREQPVEVYQVIGKAEPTHTETVELYRGP